ncbi:prepilin peptidase [Halobacillus andaensis]|uniref:prepilin peptidase n=1 Tax=Halobacillus andaensis TaxID=1176239 RepID=UPI003D727D32
MHILLLFYFLITGLILGSFYTVVGMRVPKGELFKRNRSYCPECLVTLKWFELVPVFSYCIQKGRCRYCLQKISPIYPAMECFTGAGFSYSYYVYEFQPPLFLALLLVSMFHIIFVSDLRYMIIPDKILLIFTGLIVVYRFIFPAEPWWSSIAGAFVGLMGTAVIIFVSRGGMGGGDMKLFGVIGLALGPKLLLLTFFFASLIGTVLSVSMLQLKIISREDPIPFGPYIVAGGLITVFHGLFIIDWYLSVI